jgi:hypothetical protein
MNVELLQLIVVDGSATIMRPKYGLLTPDNYKLAQMFACQSSYTFNQTTVKLKQH